MHGLDDVGNECFFDPRSHRSGARGCCLDQISAERIAALESAVRKKANNMNTIEHAAAAHAEGCRSARPRHLSRWTMPVVTLAVGAGMALNWGLLTVVGVAPFLLGALPCVAACALGLCVGAKSSLSLTVGRDLQ
jgi:hypothetical protein